MIYSCNNILIRKQLYFWIIVHFIWCEVLPLTSSDKGEISQFYEKHGIQYITLRRYDKGGALSNISQFTFQNFNKRPHSKQPELGGQSKDELFMHLFIYLKQKILKHLNMLFAKSQKSITILCYFHVLTIQAICQVNI